MGLFNKKKISSREMGQKLFQGMMKYVSDSVDDLLVKEEFGALSNDKNKLLLELMMLSFWNLQFLRCPIEIWGFALFGFFESQGISKTEKQNMINLMENRSTEYFAVWAKGMTTFLFTVAKNIHDEIAINVVAQLYIGNFLTALTEANKNALLTIKNKAKIIPFQSRKI